MSTDTQTAIFAAGCFWHPEAVFRGIGGVVDTEVGYTGGTARNPTYEQVCSRTTGHAEAVRVVFDPARVGYEELLDVFWQIHDPTQLSRQGPDVGSQYRSAIFTTDDDQRAAAEASMAAKQRHFGGGIVTEIAPATTFWRAEEYHQRYEDKQRRRFGLL